MTTLADRIVAVLAGRPGPPLALFGHSLGAVVAYEVALRLEAAGSGPAHLFASGRRAPSRYRDEQVHRRDDAGVLAELAVLNGTDFSIMDDPDVIAMIMPALRADYRAIETYRHDPGRRLRCPVTALVGDDDPRTSRDEAADWARHTDGPFTLEVLPGGHFYLVDRIADVVDVVSSTLTGGVGERPGPS
uniref:Type II thioesterase n=1 Tax=Micromonospora sp. HK160111 TaxID=1245497 RepID=A0A2H4RBZ1_9ACTN|nr:type II thioesterase [Micromonospora sp. HK160111]